MAILDSSELLKRVPLFKDLSKSQAAFLSAAMEKRKFRKGEFVVQAGKVSGFLFIILTGKALVQISNSAGREVTLATLGSGDCIGEMSVLDKQPASATVVAHTSLEGLSLDQKSFNICLSQNAQLAIAVTHTLVDRLRKANQKIASLALVSVYGRVGRYLLEKAEKNQSGKLQIRHKLSHSALAKEVGASREMVSKAMQDFKKQAFIDVLDDGTVILNERRSTPRQL